VQNRSYLQLAAVSVAIVGFIWLTFEGINHSSSTPNEKVLDSDDQISKAIIASDTQFLTNVISSLELGDSTYANDIKGQISAYQFLSNSELLNNDQKVHYARLKMEYAAGDQDIMTGVRILLAVIKSDSNNIPALEVLGEMALKSGQIQKAKERYQKLLTLQPQNEEYQKALYLVNEQIP
jgi:tetratricopeptide (TPR) repeat protein